jgi:hypothetical protein
LVKLSVDGKSSARIHWAWVVATVSAILGAAAFRSVPGVMMNPLHHEFGWSHGVVGLAMSVNMTLFPPLYSVGSSRRTNSARQSPPRARAGCVICRATTTWRSTSAQHSVSSPQYCPRWCGEIR